MLASQIEALCSLAEPCSCYIRLLQYYYLSLALFSRYSEYIKVTLPCDTTSPKKQFIPFRVYRFFIGVMPYRKPVESSIPIVESSVSAVEEVSFLDFFSIEDLPNPFPVFNPFNPVQTQYLPESSFIRETSGEAFQYSIGSPLVPIYRLLYYILFIKL